MSSGLNPEPTMTLLALFASSALATGLPIDITSEDYIPQGICFENTVMPAPWDLNPAPPSRREVRFITEAMAGLSATMPICSEHVGIPAEYKVVVSFGRGGRRGLTLRWVSLYRNVQGEYVSVAEPVAGTKIPVRDSESERVALSAIQVLASALGAPVR
ncbi:MAG: hypothetical protein AAB865_02135 [Patescibacteria group bacterium]